MRKSAPQEVAHAMLRIQDDLKRLKHILAGSTDKFNEVALLATQIRDSAGVIRSWGFEYVLDEK